MAVDLSLMEISELDAGDLLVIAKTSGEPLVAELSTIESITLYLGHQLDVDPVPVLDKFIITVQANTLTANIAAISGVSYTHWVITVDDDTEPTYPDDFTAGLHSLTKDIADWSGSEVWRLWVYDLPTTTGPTEINASDGTSGVTVTAYDTLGPVWVSGTGGFTIDNSGDYTIVAPTDAGIGLAAAETYDIYIDDVIHLSKFTATEGSVSVPSGTHTAYAVARDESGNEGQSDTDSFSISTQTAGTVSLPTVTQEVAEDLGAATTVTLTRSGGTAAFDIDVSTRDLTAEAGTNYTAISSETVSFGSGVNEKTFNFTPIDSDESTNKVCNIEIDFDSSDVANGTVEVGTESVLMKITGSAGTGNAGFQMTTSSPFYVSFQAESYTDKRSSIESGQTGDQWSITGENSRYAPILGSNKAMQAVSGNHYGTRDPHFLDPNGPYMEYSIYFPQAAITPNSATNLFDIFTRTIIHSSYPSDIWYTLVNPIVSIAVPSTTATVTTLYAHNLSDGDQIWFEDVEGTNASEYNSPSGTPMNGLTIATATPGSKVFTITGMTTGSPDAGTGNVLGSDYPDGMLFSPVFGTNSAMWWDGDNNPAAELPHVYVDEAATRLLRIYMQKSHGLIDAVTIAPRYQSWTDDDADVTENGAPGHADDENMGHVQSTFSVGSSEDPVDDIDNPEFPYLPLPDATTPSLACS